MTAPTQTQTFDTGGPAQLDLHLGFGSVRLVAGTGTTTSVTVRPAVTDRRQDQELAASTRVDHAGGVVSVRAHHRGRLPSLFRPGAVELLVEAPPGTDVTADVGYAHLVAEGRWGQVRVRSSYGDVRLDEADQVEIASSGGNVAVGVAHDGGTISNSYGPIRVTDARGSCLLRNSSGDTAVVTCRGEVQIRSAYGQVMVDSALSGSLTVVTSYGAADIGIAQGTAVRLDAHTSHGTLTNALTPTGTPDTAAGRLALQVRSGWGDIVIRRSTRQQGEAP